MVQCASTVVVAAFDCPFVYLSVRTFLLIATFSLRFPLRAFCSFLRTREEGTGGFRRGIPALCATETLRGSTSKPSLLRAAELWEKESKTASRFFVTSGWMTHGRPAGKPKEEGPVGAGRATAGGGGDGALPGAVRLPSPVTREGYFTTR